MGKQHPYQELYQGCFLEIPYNLWGLAQQKRRVIQTSQM